LRLVRLWPNARKQGTEIGQVWRVGYYSRRDGVETIWLVNNCGEYTWTVDEPFVRRHFEVLEYAKERSIYGRGRPRLGALSDRPRRVVR
jgi:hypothetical protein